MSLDLDSLKAIIAEVRSAHQSQQASDALRDLTERLALFDSDIEERCRVKGLVNAASGVRLPTADEIIGSMPGAFSAYHDERQ